MLSKLTMIGLNKYSDGALWEQLVLPEGMDKELFINECLRQGGEFPVLYADLDFMKFQIGEWSKKWLHNFDRWWKAYQFEYEALFNLDVKSTRTEIGNNEANVTSNDIGNSTARINSNGSNNDTTNVSKAAYDSNSMQPIEQTTSSGTSGVVTSNIANNSNSMTRNDKATHDITIEEYRRGNQGVTMSQEMLLAEYNAWSYNIYNHMAEIFVSEMCICIYV